MFERAKSLRTADEIKAAVEKEVEAMIVVGPTGAPTLRAPGVTGILNEADPLSTMAMQYLRDRNGGEPETVIEVATELKKAVGHVSPSGRGRRRHSIETLFAVGMHRLRATRATWPLWNHGAEVERNVDVPEPLRHAVREVFADAVRAQPARKVGAAQAPPGA